jgi:hypothetical protein
MRKTGLFLLAVVSLLIYGSNAAPADFSFWGINMGQQDYAGGSQLSFGGVAGTVQYVVSGTSYTCVNGVWFGPFDPPSPGFDYAEYRAFDAQAAFYYSDHDAVHFALIGGMDPDGVTFARGGYGDRQFGPGDLYLSIAGVNYGVGLRPGGLFWVDGDHKQLKIYRADTGDVAPANVRDAGTLGDVVLGPTWYHIDNADLTTADARAYSFFTAGSGTLTGQATVDIVGTGVYFGNYESHLYEVSIPWAALGYEGRPLDTTIGFHWNPDCGNDIIASSLTTLVPEPALIQMAGLLLGLCGLGIARFKR